MRLSIIVPFYNTGKYITDCLDSLFNQDIPEADYEVICIDDCSTDNTKDYVLQYEKSYRNLVFAEHNKNRMLGAARNTGLSIAKGKYVWFVDSDDYIKPNVLSNLLSVAENGNLDMLHFNCEKFSNDGEYFKYKFYTQSHEVTTGIKFLNSFFLEFKSIPSESCFKIFKKSFLFDYKLSFPVGVFFEDSVHSLKSYFLASRLQYLPDIIYYYRINQNSIIGNNLYSAVKLADWVYFSIKCLDFLKEWKAREHALYIELRNFYIHYICAVQTKVIFLSKRDKCIFYAKLSSFEIKRTYLSFYYRYPLISFKGLFKVFLINTKCKHPDFWKILKYSKTLLLKLSLK